MRLPLPHIARLATGLALLAFLLLRQADLTHVLTILRQASLPHLLLALLLALTSEIITAIKWTQLIRHTGGRLPLPKAIRVSLIGMFYNNFFPGSVGGDIIRILHITREAGSKARAAASTFMQRNTGLAALFAFGIPAAILIPQHFTWPGHPNHPLPPLLTSTLPWLLLAALGYLIANAILFSPTIYKATWSLLRRTETPHTPPHSQQPPNSESHSSIEPNQSPSPTTQPDSSHTPDQTHFTASSTPHSSKITPAFSPATSAEHTPASHLTTPSDNPTPTPPSRPRRLIHKLLTKLQRFHHELHGYHYWLPGPLILSLLTQLTDILIVYTLTLALHIPLPLGPLLVIVPTITLSNLIPITINGLGLREALYLSLLHNNHIPPEQAIALSLTQFATIQTLATLGGLLQFQTPKSETKS